jgi:type I restriction enzyme S subunit
MANNFPDNWRLIPLEDCMEAIIDYRGKTPKKSDSGIPLLSAKVVKGGRILEDSFEFLPAENYDTWMRRGLPKPGDVVMTTEGPLGEIAQLNSRKYALGQRIITLRGKSGLLDNDYLKFMMQSRFVQHQLEARATGTTVLGIKQRELRLVSLPLPPLPEQRAIAHILGTLDDKIELNRQMNATLEAMARALFKSWFVDFDPVHAKARGEQPVGMDAATAALFPDSFEDSDLGPIPKGWEVAPIGEHVTSVKGLSYKGSGLSKNGEGLPLHNLNSVISGGGYSHEGIKYYSGEYRQRHILKPGDVIVVNTDLTWEMERIASAAIVPSYYGERGLFSHHIFRVATLPDSPLTSSFLYFLLSASRFRTEVQGYSNGTTVNMLPADALQKPLFIVPTTELVRQFEAVVVPMLAKQEQNYEEMQSIAETRDVLLPKLMSGEIRVGEIE